MLAPLVSLLLISTAVSYIPSADDLLPDIVFITNTSFDDYEAVGSVYVAPRVEVSILYTFKEEPGYCSLGDVAVFGEAFNDPARPPLSAKALRGDALKHPIGFEMASFVNSWGYLGSNVYSMIPPDGYTCLGFVGLPHRASHDKYIKYYCCVNQRYLGKAETTVIFEDTEQGVGVYEVVPPGNDGISAQTFIWKSPQYIPDLDDQHYIDINTLMNHGDYKLRVYETNSVAVVEHLNSHDEISIWATEYEPPYYSLGNIVTSHRARPSPAHIVYCPHSNVLRVPDSYNLVHSWSLLQTWKPLCPDGFVSLGMVATNGSSPSEAISREHCINIKYVVFGEWEKKMQLWHEGFDKNGKSFAIWEAKAKGPGGLGLGLMSIMYGKPPSSQPAYVLDASLISYFKEKPVRGYHLGNITFGARSMVTSEEINLPFFDEETGKELPLKTIRSPMSSGEYVVKDVRIRVDFVPCVQSFVFTADPVIRPGMHMNIDGAACSEKEVSSSYSYTTGNEQRQIEQLPLAFCTEKSPWVTLRPEYISYTNATVEAFDIEYEVGFVAVLTKTYFDGTKSAVAVNGVSKRHKIDGLRVKCTKPIPPKEKEEGGGRSPYF
jgi:hypothetical protein